MTWSWTGLTGSDLPSILSLVGEEVTTIIIRNWYHRDYSEQLLHVSMAIIASKFRHLTTYEFDFSSYVNDEDAITTATSSVASSLVSSLHSLTTFVCRNIPLSPASILHLAELSTLRNCYVRLSDESTEWPALGPAHRPFASLTRITLATTLAAYIPFSKAVALPHIKELTLDVAGDLVAHLIPHFFAAIRHQYSPMTLDCISIRPLGKTDTARAQQSTAVVRSAHLRPLLEFSLIKEFDLTMPCHHAFDDAFILDIAKAWPRLVSLYLSEVRCVHDSRPSLTALVHLAMYAHNLRGLGFEFDAARWKPTLHGFPAQVYGDLQGRASFSHVHSLVVGASPIAWPEHVAHFLACVFPVLRHVIHVIDENSSHLEMWQEVGEYMYTAARKRAAAVCRGDEASDALSPLASKPTMLGTQ